MRDVHYIEMTSDELDQIMKEWLGITFESVAEFEWSNDSSYTTEIGPGCKVFDWEAAGFEGLLSTGTIPSFSGIGLHQLLQGFYVRGWLEAGEYLITVSW